MITIRLSSNRNGQNFRIDTDDRELAARWLLDTCLRLCKGTGTIPPVVVDQATAWVES